MASGARGPVATITFSAVARSTLSENPIEAISTIDRAAKKGAIHPNKAARLKSRLMKRENATAVAQ
jgi:ribosomal protein S20